MNLIKDLIYLFFPHRCPVCSSEILSHEAWLCNTCIMDMPLTYFWDIKQNPMEQKFWGLLPLEGACSLIHYSKSSDYIKLIYGFKYSGRWSVAYNMGRYFGNILKSVEPFANADYIVPVPLHTLRTFKRGYNQAEYIARGLATALRARVDTHSLKRIVHNQTQTKKNKYERWDNVENIFQAGDLSHFKGKHIILVDDVLTTGSTIVSCGEEILRKQPFCRLSIVTLASRVDIPGRGAVDDEQTIVNF